MPRRSSTSHTPRPTHWWATLKARLMLASVLVIASSVALTTTVVVQRMAQRSEQAVMGLERDNTERMASLLGQRVVGMQRQLRASAGHVPAAALTDGDAAAAFLDDNPALTVGFASVALVAPDGRMLATHDGNVAAQTPLDMSPRDYFRATVAEGVPQVSAPFAGRVVREPIIQLTMPIFGDGQVIGVLAATLRLSSRNLLDDLTYAGHAGDSIVTVVADARGTIVSHPVRDHVMRSIDAEPGLVDAVAHWVAQGRPMEPSGFVLHHNGVIVSMAGVPGADWLVFRVAPDDALLGGLVQARREAVLWGVGVALLGGLLILGLLALLLGPLSRLRRRALALQDSGRAIDDGWPDASGEIGELSRALQHVLRERAAGEHANQQLLQQMGSVLKSAPIGIAFTREQRFELLGAEFNALLGWADGALVGRPMQDVFASHAEHATLLCGAQADFNAGRPHMAELQLRRHDGSGFWGRLKGTPVDPRAPAAGTIWLLEDVTERRAVRERLSWSASHDGLTRLLNRAAFEERLQLWLDGVDVSNSRGGRGGGDGSRGTRPACLLFIDLDRFKQVNDNAGHAAGDAVLRDVATVLQEMVRADDTAARLGGDEFAVLLPGCVGSVALQLAERVRAAVARVGVQHEGRWLGVDASIGVVEVQRGRSQVADWMGQADAACYAAKHAGRGTVRLAGAPAAGNPAPAANPANAANAANAATTNVADSADAADTDTDTDTAATRQVPQAVPG